MRFLTIRQTAATGILPENKLRAMQKSGELPGFMSGNRFLVNLDQLEALLDSMSCPSVKEEGDQE